LLPVKHLVSIGTLLCTIEGEVESHLDRPLSNALQKLHHAAGTPNDIVNVFLKVAVRAIEALKCLELSSEEICAYLPTAFQGSLWTLHRVQFQHFAHAGA
jgi:hypothetical protein